MKKLNWILFIIALCAISYSSVEYFYTRYLGNLLLFIVYPVLAALALLIAFATYKLTKKSTAFHTVLWGILAATGLFFSIESYVHNYQPTVKLHVDAIQNNKGYILFSLGGPKTSEVRFNEGGFVHLQRDYFSKTQYEFYLNEKRISPDCFKYNYSIYKNNRDSIVFMQYYSISLSGKIPCDTLSLNAINHAKAQNFYPNCTCEIRQKKGF